MAAIRGDRTAAEVAKQFKVHVRHALTTDQRSRRYINDTMRRAVSVFRWGAAEAKIPPSVPQALALVPGLRRSKTTARETDPIPPVGDDALEATLPFLPRIVGY